MDANVVTLECGDGTLAKVHLYGATVISWKNKGVEQLFLSSLTKLDGSKAIRGGIPLVFPNFSTWSCGPKHGFARICWWKTVEEKKLEDGGAEASFSLEDTEETRAMWNFKFHLRYTVTLRPGSLTSSLHVTNDDSKPFDFTTLIHTYFRVSQISDCSVTGFEGCKYDDKVVNEDGKLETRAKVVIDKNVDYVYASAGSNGHVVDSRDRKVKLEKQNLPDTVLWNPWIQLAKEMGDLDDDGYLYMVCVEAGHVASRKVLPAGETFKCSQTLTVMG